MLGPLLNQGGPRVEHAYLVVHGVAILRYRVVRAIVLRLLVDPVNLRIALLHIQHGYALKHFRVGAIILKHGHINTFSILALGLLLALRLFFALIPDLRQQRLIY